MNSLHPLVLLRSIYGWSQDHLAMEAGISPTTVKSKEKRVLDVIRKRPEKDMSIARTFGLSYPEYMQLLGGQITERTAQKIAENAAKQPDGQKLTAAEVLENFGG